MHLKVYYSEINSFIAKKLDQPLKVDYGYNGKVKVEYTYTANVILLGEVRKDISISLSVYSVSSDKVVLKADSDAVVKFFLPIVLNAVADRNELDFLSASGDEITISLNDISGLSSVLQSIILEQLYVFDDGIDVQATFK